MRFQKLSYLDDTNNDINENISKRVEFFFHYWQFLFSSQNANYDQFYLKSHRTVIDKVQLQIDGNFQHAKKNINLFFTNDEQFENKNIILKKIKKSKERKAITELKKLSKTSTNQWKVLKPKKFHTQLNKIKKWLESDYSKLITECLIELLEKSTPLNDKDINDIKKLTNYFIIELFNKGFNSKTILDITESLSDYKKFPFEKIMSDFETIEEYELYKFSEWSTMSLKKQIGGIFNLLNRPSKSRFLIFRIYDVNLRVDPLKFFNVEFYNPNVGKNPKINHKSSFKLFEETFTSKPASYKNSSQCNACLKIEGIQEDQMYYNGYKKVKSVLSILNRELNINGKVYQNNVFITNDNFDQIWGNDSALFRGFQAVDEISNNQLRSLQYLEKLNLDYFEDKQVFDLISSISDILIDKEAYYPEKLWMILEATFDSKDEIEKLFKNIYRLYLNKNFALFWKQFINNSLNSNVNIFLHPELDYEISIDDLSKINLKAEDTTYNLNKFIDNISILEKLIPTPFIKELVKYIKSYKNDTVNFYKSLDYYIKYNIAELYSQRNLTVHSNMSDELFLLKQKEMKSMVNIVLEIFVFIYLKPDSNRSIKKTVSKISAKAALL